MVSIALGSGNIRQLTRDLKKLASDLRDTTKVDIEQGVGAITKEILESQIASITDVDGNYLGTDNPNAAISVEVGLPGHDVLWRGRQIAFVEFGTGALGVGYPGIAMSAAGYAPDPTKRVWVYPDAKSGKPEISHGLAPQAPMYRTAAIMRNGAARSVAKLILRRAVQDAVTIR